MPLSLAPLLAAAVALFVLLISHNPVLSAIFGIVSWRALLHLAKHGGAVVDEDSIRNPLPKPNDGPRQNQSSPVALARRSDNTDTRASQGQTAPADGPPLLTDFIKIGREMLQSRSGSPVDDGRDDSRHRGDAQAEVLTRPRGPSKWLPTASRESIKDMHTTPTYMRELAALDLRISLGEITDEQYDKLYDRILESAGP